MKDDYLRERLKMARDRYWILQRLDEIDPSVLASARHDVLGLEKELQNRQGISINGGTPLTSYSSSKYDTL